MNKQNQAASPKDNITKFRPDRRLAIVGTLRSIALLTMLAAIVSMVWQFGDEISWEALRRVTVYMQANSERSGEFTHYDFEPGISTEVRPFEAGLAVISEVGFTFASGYEEGDFSAQLGYVNPVMSLSDNQALIYDAGNTGYSIMTSYSVLASAETDGPILSGSLSSNDYFALVTDESGYRAAVTIYDDDRNQLLKWHTSEYYILSATVSPDGKTFSALCILREESQVSSRLLTFEIGQEQPMSVIDLGENAVYSAKYYGDDTIIILHEQAVCMYNIDGQQVWQQPYEHLTAFVHDDEAMPLLTFTQGSGKNQSTTLMLCDSAGNVSYTNRFNGSFGGVGWGGQVATMLMDDSAVVIDLNSPSDPLVQSFDAQNARDVYVTADGHPVLIYADSASKLTGEAPDVLKGE